MSTPTVFQSSGDIVIQGNQQFHQVNGNVYNCCGHGICSSSCWRKRKVENLLPMQDRYEVIQPGQIILRKEVWSEDLRVSIGWFTKTTNPFRNRLLAKISKVQKRVYTAELVQYIGRKFTVIMFLPENEDDREIIKLVSPTGGFLRLVWLTRYLRYGNKFARVRLTGRSYL
ncbi:hypothetical protein PQX77_012468 [Marasmius sp. AFHP31]|nr:hypothetical protein PQX77_012468 [Marasmius sp. AFHP31]